jgi:cytochrome b561
MSTTTGYSPLQIALHWGVALGVLFNYFVSEGMEDAFDAAVEGEAMAEPAGFGIPGGHVWVGVAVLALVVIRLLVRRSQGAPAAEPGFAGVLATWGHRALYLLMLAVPALGAISWFGGIDATAEPHALLANVLMVLAGAHALMALFHQYVLKDGVLARMLRAR